MIKTTLTKEDIHDERFNYVCEQILNKMDSFQVPGVSVGILCDGIKFTAGLGITNIDHPMPVTSSTFFQIGSTGKTYTAVAVMRLVEQGKLDLDTPLRSYMPDLRFKDPEVTEQATMRHILTHTGGWLGDHFVDFGTGDDALQRYAASLETVPQLTRPGEVFSYCNSGFILAGRIIEVLTGKTYEAAMQELVLDPLGLKNTHYFAHDVMNRLFASGHRNEPDTNMPAIANPWPVPRFAAPAGGVIADIHDQLIYARFLMGDGTAGDGTRILEQQTLNLIHTPMAKAGGGLGESIGLSLMLRDIDGVRVAFHGGSINGQQSDFQLIPSRNFALALTTNADNGIFLHLEMSRLIFETFMGLKAPDPTYIKLSEQQLAEYVGVYKKPNDSGFSIQIDEECRLVVTSLDEENPEVFIAEFVDEDMISIITPPAVGMRCDFLRAPDGKIRWFRESGRIAKRIEEKSS